MAGRGAATGRPSLAALSVVIEAAELEAWVTMAEPGDKKIYCEGPALPQGSATVVLARELYDDGLVTLLNPRSDKGFQWIARRRAPEVNPPQPARHLPAPTAETEDDLDTAVLRQLKRAANFAMVCPTNGEIARACGLPNPDAASYRIRKLMAAGLIRVLDRGPNERRIVTIAETGKHTIAGAL